MRKSRRTCFPDRSTLRTDSSKFNTTVLNDRTVRRPEPESGTTNDTSSLYGNYLQTLMVEHLIKEKARKRGKDLMIQLASLDKKKVEYEQKLHEVKTRVHEIETLNTTLPEMEAQVKQTESFLAENESKLGKVFKKIYSNLENFDKLAVLDVNIPSTPEELEAFFDLLEHFSESLNSFENLIGDKAYPMISMNKNLKEFTDAFSTAEKLLKSTHENLAKLEIEVLKKCSATLQ